MKNVGKIKDVCIVIAGQSPSGASYNDNGVGMEFHQGKKAFGENVIGHSKIWTTEITKVAEPGDILMSVRAPVGPTNITNRNICIGRGLAAIRCSGNILPQYILYALRNIESKIVGNDGAVFNSINKKQIEDLPLPILSLSEQQRIVDYLDSAFAKIDAMKANAEKALNEAKALFQASLKEMLEPKEGWEEKKMNELCSIKSKLVDPTIDENRKLKHVGGANIISFTGELIDLKTASEENLTSGKFKFDDSVVLYNKIRPYLVKVAIPGFSGLCSADMYPLTPNSNVCRNFLYFILISKDFTDYAVKRSARAGMPKVNRECLFAYKCFVPRYEEQKRIVEHLDSLKSKVDCMQANFEKISQECDALKQSILRQVFE